MSSSKEPIGYLKWRSEAVTLFGKDEMDWAFRCPCCRHAATTRDYKAAGAPIGAVAFSCIGRWSGAKREAFCDDGSAGPCNYAGGGLICVNPIGVIDDSEKVQWRFAFASACDYCDEFGETGEHACNCLSAANADAYEPTELELEYLAGYPT